jgi:hypothetical protein
VKLLSFHNSSIDDNLLIIISVIAAVIVQIMDKSFGNTFTLSLGNTFPRADILVFGLMVLISITIQSMLIKKTRRSLNLERSKSKLGKAVVLISIFIQYAAAGILIITLFQIIFTSEYSIVLLETIVGINLITSSVLLAILSSRFLRAFRKSPNKIVLAYAISIAILSLSDIITFIYVDNFLHRKPDYITSQFSPWASYSPTASTNIVSAYQIMGIVSFVALWIATVFLTNHYASKTKTKYWIMVSLPIIYFASIYLISYLEHLNLLEQLGVQDNPLYGFTYNLFLNTVRTAGGIMFGVAFFILSKTIMHTQLKKSIVTSGTGLVVLFSANASSLIIMTLYPPWGIISVTFSIIGSYLLIIGLDSATFYLATDASLRRIIAKSPQQEYDLLKSLGYSETENIVASKVKNFSRQVYNEIEFDNLFYISSEPTNIQEYVNKVLMELRKGNRTVLRKGKDESSSQDQK